MFFKKRIVVTIGYNGTIIAFHAKNSIKQKFFFEKFDSEAVLKLKPYFTRFKRANISILLDTVDQTYKKKFFPAVRKMDLKNLVRRELGGVTNKDSLKSFFSHKVIHEKSKSGKITQIKNESQNTLRRLYLGRGLAASEPHVFKVSTFPSCFNFFTFSISVIVATLLV